MVDFLARKIMMLDPLEKFRRPHRGQYHRSGSYLQSGRAVFSPGLNETVDASNIAKSSISIREMLNDVDRRVMPEIYEPDVAA
jgi:hypothetical protein